MALVPLDPEIRERLAAVVMGATSWADIFERLRASVPDGEEPKHRALLHAFAYDLVSPEEVDRLAREGSVFGAMFEFADGRRMPPRLADVSDEDVEVWVDAFDAVDDPRLRSRVGDLLWSRRARPQPHLKGLAACEALVELSRVPDWEDLERTEGLVRALDLAHEMSNATLAAQVAERMAEVASAELERADRPGIPFRLLRALVISLRSSGQRSWPLSSGSPPTSTATTRTTSSPRSSSRSRWRQPRRSALRCAGGRPNCGARRPSSPAGSYGRRSSRRRLTSRARTAWPSSRASCVSSSSR